MEIDDTQLGRRDWDADLGAAAMQHGWTYGAIAARHGARTRRVELRDGGARGLAQVICRSLGPVGIAYLPLGILWKDRAREAAAPLAELQRWLSRDRPHLLAAPSWHRPQRLSLRLSGPRDLAVLDLVRGDPRGGLAKKWRNRLRVAERSGLEVSARPDVPGWLVETERLQQRRRRYGNLTPGWISAWQRLAPGAALTLMAGPAKAPVAAMSFVLHGRGATYLLGWTSAEGRRLSAHNLLMWKAMTALRGRGFGRLDLGQIDSIANPGLARFKLGTGAELFAVPPIHALAAVPGSGRWPHRGSGPAADPVGQAQ